MLFSLSVGIRRQSRVTEQHSYVRGSEVCGKIMRFRPAALAVAHYQEAV